MLRDREPRRKTPDTLEDETPAEGFDIGGSLEEQNRDLTIEETRRNIEELRPGDSRDLVGREFDKILKTIMDGFTSSQLEGYVCYFIRKIEGKSDLMAEAERKHLLRRLTGQQRAELRWPVRPRYSWIRQQFSWKPPKNYPWGSTMKEKLVLAIMRTCWHLQAMEETPYIGQVNTVVDPQILNLLQRKDLPTLSWWIPLTRLSGEKIVAVRSTFSWARRQHQDRPREGGDADHRVPVQVRFGAGPSRSVCLDDRGVEHPVVGSWARYATPGHSRAPELSDGHLHNIRRGQG